jgi:hypothetical protein
MSKLKKIMGTGTVITVLFAAPITVINQSTPALSQTVQVVAGATQVGNTAWQQYPDGEGVFVDVDTSHGGFTTTPIYITSLGGTSAHWHTTGATSIYLPTPRGFRVYVRWANGGPLTPAVANQNGWHINWIATPRTSPFVIGPV